MKTRVVVQGRTYIALETAAECYQVDAAFVHRVYVAGLLGNAERAGDVLMIEVSMLEQLAQAVRLHHHLGFDLETVALLLELES
jgi:hypothetical protein